MTACPLIYDCDPGVDDAIALFLAFASPAELDLIGITTVGGNVPGALTARNACLIEHVRIAADDQRHRPAPGFKPFPVQRIRYAPDMLVKAALGDQGAGQHRHQQHHPPCPRG